MTTIAYRDGIMAADSLRTGSNWRMGTSRKVSKAADGSIAGATGTAAWNQSFLKWFEDGRRGDPPSSPEDSGAFVVEADGTMKRFHSAGWEVMADLPFWSDGSGDGFAMGAMQFGATAEQAVKAASAWDTKTGGEIVTLHLGIDR